jgi:[ribosomal protein S18]-alanine N-acetyltransferase
MSGRASGIRIRRMTAADLDRVIEIAESLKQAPQWTQAAYESALIPGALPRRVVLVADGADFGGLVGFTVTRLTPPEAELESIAVAAERQRQGVGRKLFESLAAELRREQVRDVLLEVRASNHQAQALYHALGFAETGRRSRYYADPIEDAVQMALRLGEG